jgi:hypothetical protein
MIQHVMFSFAWTWKAQNPKYTPTCLVNAKILAGQLLSSRDQPIHLNIHSYLIMSYEHAYSARETFCLIQAVVDPYEPMERKGV